MHNGKYRILFFAEAVTLAHMARPFVLAESLDAAGHAVHFACDTRYMGLFPAFRFRHHPLGTIASDRFIRALAQGRPLYDSATLERYAAEDVELIQKVNPDLVIGDFRLSLAVSARLTQTRYIALSNAYWSPYANPRYILPELPLNRFTGLRLGQTLFDRVRPLVFALHAIPLNRVRKKHGLPTLGHDLRRAYTEADLTLYADIPELVPTFGLPSHHRYLGPVIWSPRLPPPPWWDGLDRSKPVVYLTLGSSGHAGALATLLSALSGTDLTVIAATAGAPAPETQHSGVHCAPYLPGEAACALASLVICNGGSPTTHQALAAGKPVIGIPANLDQYLNMSYIEDAGAGIMLRSGGLDGAAVLRAVRQILENPSYRAKAETLGETFARYPARRLFSNFIASELGA